MLKVIFTALIGLQARQTGLYSPRYKTWPNGVVCYEIPMHLFTTVQIQMLRQAMNEFQTKTPVRFITLEHCLSKGLKIACDSCRNYVRLSKDNGCFAAVGMTSPAQKLSLPDNCFGQNRNIRTIIHELGHSIGLLHEHQRPDRGIVLLKDNIPATQASRYEAYTVRPLSGTPYDPWSVMHYPDYYRHQQHVMCTPVLTCSSNQTPVLQHGYWNCLPPGIILCRYNGNDPSHCTRPREEHCKTQATKRGTFPQLSQGDVDTILKMYPRPRTLAAPTRTPAPASTRTWALRRVESIEKPWLELVEEWGPWIVLALLAVLSGAWIVL